MSPSQQHSKAGLFDFSGGVNTSFANTQLAQNEMEDCRNYHLQTRGGLEKRGGYSDYLAGGDSATGNDIVGLWQHIDKTNGKFVMRIEGTDIDYDNSGTWTDITGSETVTSGKNNRWVFQTFRANTIMTNGTDIPLKWSGSGNVSKITRAIDGGSDTIDAAATLVRHDERIVLGDVTATESMTQTRYESRIWPSDAGTLDTWKTGATGKIDIDQGDGDSITALLDVQGFLVVFKQNSLHRVSDFGDSSNQTRIRVAAVGTPGPHTAIVANDLIYFLDSAGRLWAYDVRQGDNPDALQELTRDKLGQDTLDTFVKDRLPYAHLLYSKARNEIYCFVSVNSSATTNRAWVFNIATGGFTRMDWAIDPNVSFVYRDSNDDRQILLGSHGGLIVEADDGVSDGWTNAAKDDGTAITASFKTRQLALDDIGLVKLFKYVDLYASTTGESQDVTFEHFKDFQITGDSYTVDVGTGTADTLG